MKHRIQFDIPQTQIAELDKISRTAGVTNRKDLFNNALTLLQWAIKEVEDGRLICSITPDEKSYRELSMPWMNHVRSKS